MTAREVYEKLGTILKHHPEYGDFEAAIPIQGIGGPRVSIKTVTWGFDWYANTMLFMTERRLSDGREI